MKTSDILFTRQHHLADRAGDHYDIRLVIGNKAHSFATRKDIPEPGKSIMLYETSVHTKDYALRKRIVIPKGNYGSGTTTLDFVRKAKLVKNEEKGHFVMETTKGERFLLKPLSISGQKTWLFKNLGEAKKDLEKEASEHLAVVVKGNPKIVNNPKYKSMADSLYTNLKNRLEEKGYKVEFDQGLPYTSPNEKAVVVIGHSRGIDRLRFLDKNVIGIPLETKDNFKTLLQKHSDRKKAFLINSADPLHYELSDNDTQKINNLPNKKDLEKEASRVFSHAQAYDNNSIDTFSKNGKILKRDKTIQRSNSLSSKISTSNKYINLLKLRHTSTIDAGRKDIIGRQAPVHTTIHFQKRDFDKGGYEASKKNFRKTVDSLLKDLDSMEPYNRNKINKYNARIAASEFFEQSYKKSKNVHTAKKIGKVGLGVGAVGLGIYGINKLMKKEAASKKQKLFSRAVDLYEVKSKSKTKKKKPLLKPKSKNKYLKKIASDLINE